jgi:hypothetical protein
MASFLDHKSGTTTKMGSKYHEQTCVSMWDELAENEKLQSFADLIALWYRNLQEYVETDDGTVASGELPFAVRFLSSEWLPELKPEELQKLRVHFCEKADPDESASEVVDVAASEEDVEASDVQSKCE